MSHSLIYTDNAITDAEWNQILGLRLVSGLTKLLALLHERGNVAIPVGELSDFFRSGHPAQLNGVFSKLKLPYRIANDGGQPWTVVLPYEKRSIKLYKTERRPTKEVRVRPDKPYRCPPIYFNPSHNKSTDREGVIKLGFVGVRDEERPWNTVAEMQVKGSISIGPNGSGFIHILPTRQEMDKVIGYLQEMRDLIPEE